MQNFRFFSRGIIFNENKQVLVIRKKQNQKIGPGSYFLPGGTTEFGEEIADTLVREIKEESNLDVIKYIFVGHIKVILGNTHWLGCFYLCEVENLLSLANLEVDKHDFIGFVDTNNLHKLDGFVGSDIVKKCLNIL